MGNHGYRLFEWSVSAYWVRSRCGGGTGTGLTQKFRCCVHLTHLHGSRTRHDSLLVSILKPCYFVSFIFCQLELCLQPSTRGPIKSARETSARWRALSLRSKTTILTRKNC